MIIINYFLFLFMIIKTLNILINQISFIFLFVLKIRHSILLIFLIFIDSSFSTTFFLHYLCCSFDEANYFSSTNIKRTFFSLFLCWLYYLKQNIWCVCACMSRKLFHTHTYIVIVTRQKKKKRRKRLVLIYSSLKE